MSSWDNWISIGFDFFIVVLPDLAPINVFLSWFSCLNITYGGPHWRFSLSHWCFYAQVLKVIGSKRISFAVVLRKDSTGYVYDTDIVSYNIQSRPSTLVIIIVFTILFKPQLSISIKTQNSKLKIQLHSILRPRINLNELQEQISECCLDILRSRIRDQS